MSTMTIRTGRGVRDAVVRLRSTPIRVAVLTASIVLIGLFVLDYTIALLRPETRGQVWLWTTATMLFPIWFVGKVMLGSVLVTIVLGARRILPARVVELLLVVEMAAYFFGTRISPQTGDQVGWMMNSAQPNLALSEPLADFVHKCAYWVSGSFGGVRYVSPVFGVFTVVVVLLLARRLSTLLGLPRWVFQAVLVATPIPFWYVVGYTENTFLAIPFLLLGALFLIEHVVDQDRGLRTLVPATLGFALAALFHAGFAVLCAALAVVLLLQSGVTLRRRLVQVAQAVGISLATAAVVLLVMLLFPIRYVAGNVVGGYDNLLFTPMTLTPGDPLSRFTMFSHAHLIEVSNIVVHASPVLVLALPVLAIVFRRRLRELLTTDSVENRVVGVFAAMTIMYVLFIAVWGFDLGSVWDLDLMLTMDAGLGLLAVTVVALLLKSRPAVLAVLLAGSAFVNIAFYSMKVANVWAS